MVKEKVTTEVGTIIKVEQIGKIVNRDNTSIGKRTDQDSHLYEHPFDQTYEIHPLQLLLRRIFQASTTRKKSIRKMKFLVKTHGIMKYSKIKYTKTKETQDRYILSIPLLLSWLRLLYVQRLLKKRLLEMRPFLLQLALRYGTLSVAQQPQDQINEITTTETHKEMDRQERTSGEATYSEIIDLPQTKMDKNKTMVNKATQYMMQ